jgi:formate/nitrite transporter FocA (FNT family)
MTGESAGEESTRPSAHEIYERVIDDARAELERPPANLAFSGIYAGLSIGLSGLGAAAAFAALPPSVGLRTVIAFLVYPLGFLAAVLGRGQLFTENTLYPVALSLGERRYLPATARLWAIVYACNIVGAIAFAFLAMKTGALSHAISSQLAHLGGEAQRGSLGDTFWSGVIAGWLLAAMAWLVEAGDELVGQFLVVVAVAFLVGLGQFDHCIASAAEVFSATVDGGVGVGRAIAWLAVATAGNVAGGVLIVTLLNYGQTRRS